MLKMGVRTVQPAGASPLHPTPFSLVAPKEKGGKEMRSNASGGLGPSGEAVHCSSLDQPVRSCAKFRGAKVAGVPAPHTTERYESQAASIGRQRARALEALQAPQGPGFCSLFVAESPCAASLVCGAGTPATLAPQVFALPERAGGRMSDAPPAPDGPRPPEALSAFLFPPFLWRSKEKGVRVQGRIAPAGCTAHHKSQCQ